MLVAQLCPTLCETMTLTSRLLCPGTSQAGILELLSFPSPGDHPDPGIKPRSSALQTDSLPSEPQRIFLYLKKFFFIFLYFFYFLSVVLNYLMQCKNRGVKHLTVLMDSVPINWPKPPVL